MIKVRRLTSGASKTLNGNCLTMIFCLNSFLINVNHKFILADAGKDSIFNLNPLVHFMMKKCRRFDMNFNVSSVVEF